MWMSKLNQLQYFQKAMILGKSIVHVYVYIDNSQQMTDRPLISLIGTAIFTCKYNVNMIKQSKFIIFNEHKSLELWLCGLNWKWKPTEVSDSLDKKYIR